MTPDSDQLELYGMMKDAWGDRLASAVYDRLPPMDSSDIATKADIDRLAVQLRGEMSELRGEMSELRGELAALRGEFRASTRHTIVTIIAAAVSIWLSFYLPAVL